MRSSTEPGADRHDRVRKLLEQEGTAISWTDLTYNPWIGCTKVSPACEHCYAEDLMGTDGTRMKRVPWGAGEERLRTGGATRNAPLRWQRIAEAAGVTLRVFCLSLGDWADNEVPDQWRFDLADTIERTPNLLWLLLTKRIGNVPRMLALMFPQGVPANVRVGATIVSQEEWNRDAPKIAAASVATGQKCFLSVEPMLGAIKFDLPRYRWQGFVGLVIVGGESGRHARPMHPAWPLEIGDQCWNAGVPFHFKQWGEFVELEDPLPAAPTAKEGARPIDIVGFTDGVQMIRVGERKAGRMLAGQEWLEQMA